MDAGESVAVSVLLDDEWECPFSHDDKSPTVDNMLSNNGQTLGRNMDNGVSTAIKDPPPAATVTDAKPEFHSPTKIDIQDENYELKVKVAAHHLIPGEASLPKSSIMEFVSKDAGIIKSDIGYRVNGAENGAWLPGNYGVDKWGDLTMPATGKAKMVDIENEYLQAEYAYAAMELTQSQFHDAHEAYSDFVVQALNKMHLKYLMGSIAWCEKCKKEAPLPPPYAMVKKLNVLSGRLRAFLLFPPGAWRIPLFTSIWSLRLKANYSLKKS